MNTSTRVLFLGALALLVLVAPAVDASPATAAVLPPSIATSFGAATVALSGSVSLSFSISNPNTLGTVTVGFTDDIPAGLVVSTASGLSDSCGGTASAVAGSTSVTLSGGSLGHGTCNVSLNVTGTSPGEKDNSVTLTSNGVTENTATASVTVVAPPSVSGYFAARWVAVGAKTRLDIEPGNTNTATTLHNVGFTDTLPAGLVVATPNGLSVFCNSGSVTAAPGSHQIKLSGTTLTPDGTTDSACAIHVDVRGVKNGVATDSGMSSSAEGGPATFSESLPVVAPGPRVFWANGSFGQQAPSTINFAKLDGSVGSKYETTPASTNEPQGMAIDSTTGRIYWLNLGGPFGVSFVSFDGKAYGNLNVAGASSARSGLAIDQVHGRIYWTGPEQGAVAEHVSFARLDGTGGGTIPIAGATPPSQNSGVAIDIAGGRLYWMSPKAISYARLDGSGGGDIPLVGTLANQPNGVAIDATTKKIYWTNGGNNTIGVANLDGTAAKTLSISGATINGPYGVAIDIQAKRLYWANGQPGAYAISWAPLSGGAGGNLATPGTTISDPATLLLLYPPTSQQPPHISGHSTKGSKLTCSTGTWAKDLNGASFYVAPFAITYAWTRNGAAITGAKTNTVTASSSGSYACAATATNMAGSTTKTSARVSIS